jgi:hypothetical protein
VNLIKQSLRLQNFPVEWEFCPERDNLKIARSFNCGIQSQKFPSPAGAAEKRAQKLKTFSIVPLGLAFFGLLSRR